MGRFLDLNQLRPGDIILTAERTLVSRTLQWAGRLFQLGRRGFPYSHAILVIDRGLFLESTLGEGINFTTLLDTQLRSYDGMLHLIGDRSHQIIVDGGHAFHDQIIADVKQQRPEPCGCAHLYNALSHGSCPHNAYSID